MKESSGTKGILALMIGAIGVVYGDIGTSPLYALKSCFTLTGLGVTPDNILGIISLFLWILIIVVYCKYIFTVMRCDQNGEGGVLILASLCKNIDNQFVKKVAVSLGIIGLSLFVGDSVITPAISVLSACEGLALVTNISEHHIILIAATILFFLFFLQSQGSGNIGRYFGYIMLLWFIVIGLLGLLSIIKNPIILYAVNPYHAITFIINNKLLGFAAIGGSILVVSGVEALYADMGHFGKKSIQYTWSIVVFPALSLNYLGQGALLLNDPGAIDNIFYKLTPENMMYPMISLSLIATIIASQAVISGIFSLAHQAIMLNYLPRLTIKHTSFYQIGQIYIPAVNYLLFILTISAIVLFRSSEALSFAYGLSVASVMIVTTLFTSLIAYYRWKWSSIKMLLFFLPMFFLDILFVSSNLNKIFEGAWYTIAISLLVIYIIKTWISGSEILKLQRESGAVPLKPYLKNYIEKYKVRIPGCAAFMTRYSNSLPGSMLINLNHNKYLHEKILFISIITEEVPRVPLEEKFSVTQDFKNIFHIQARFGFYETPDLNKVISWVESQEILKSEEDISFFLSRGLPIADAHHCLGSLSEKIYIFLSRNSLPAYEFFKIDPKKLIELGVIFKV